MSVLRLTALSVLATVFAWSVWSDGLPVDRPVVVGWLLAFAVVAWGGRRPGLAARAVADWLPIVMAMVAYDLSRGAADTLGMPVQVRLPIVVDERMFGTVPTVWLQQHLGPFTAHVAWWEVIVSVVYVSHFIVPFALGIWLWARRPARFVWWRDRFLTITAMGLVTYVLLPTTPPWLASLHGQLPTVHRTAARGWSLLGIGIADRVFDLGRAAFNPVAALPSLHAAFAALTAVTLWRAAPRWTRALLVAYPVLMGLALVVSGEHYVFDVLVGVAYVAIAVVVWRRIDLRLTPWRARRAAALAATPQPVPEPVAPPVAPPDRSIPRPVWVTAAVMAGVALFTRGVRLGRPDVMVFDEAFYALQALDIAQHGVEIGHSVHPPAAKWAIAIGIRAIGFNPIGWRIVPLLAGTLVVGATVLAAHRATASLRLAGLAGLIVLTDGIAVVTGRLALLDGLVALFTTAALVLLVTFAAQPLDGALLRRITLPVALLFGLAVSCKWSAVPVWLASTGLVGWLAGVAHLPRRRLLTVLLAVPVAVYLVTLVPTYVQYPQSAVARVACADGVSCSSGPIDRVEGIVHDQWEVYQYHSTLVPTNRYAVSSWNWILQTKPTLLYTDRGHSIWARSNPVIWFAGALALMWCAWFGGTRRRPVPLLLGITAGSWWAPWAIGQRPGYAFYAAPLVPVLAVGLVVAIAALPTRWRSPATAITALVAVAGAALLVPQWYAL